MLIVLKILFPYLVLLYLIDCIAYVRHQHLLFSSYLGRYFRIKKPGLHFVGLLPTSEAIVSNNVPIFLTSRGIYTLPEKYYNADARYKAQNLNFTTYEDIVKIEAEGKVMRINGESIIRFPSDTNAKQMTELIRQLTYLEPSGRHERIRTFLDETLHLPETHTNKRAHWSLNYVKILSSFLFVYVFGILPLILYSGLSKYINLPVFVSLLVLLYLSILVMAYVVRRKIIGTTTSLRTFASVILSPVTAVHILKELTKEIYVRFDYLAIAAVLLPSPAFQSEMRRELLRIIHTKEEEQNADLKEFWSLRENMLRSLLTETGIEMQELFSAPDRQDPSATSYCPLCLNEYTVGATKCVDCGLYLREFTDSYS